MRPLKEKISITVDSDLLEVLRVQAEKDDRSLSQYINLILRQHCKKTDEMNKNKERFVAVYHICPRRDRRPRLSESEGFAEIIKISEKPSTDSRGRLSLQEN